MTLVTLFGIALAPLYTAIAQVESDNGIRSENVYQIKKIYVDDVNRIYPQMKFRYADVYDREKSELMMFLYWKHYGYLYAKETGGTINAQILAKMHNRGGMYWKQGRQTQAFAERYWCRVRIRIEGLLR